MKNIYKCAIGVIMVFCCCFASTTLYAKTGVEKTIGYETKIPGTIFVDGKVWNLYKEFVNPKKVLEDVKVKYNKELRQIQKKFGLKEFSENTWREYQNKYREANLHYSVELRLGKFFDVYENKSDNERIRQISLKNSLSEKEKREMMELPFDYGGVDGDKEIGHSGFRYTGKKIPNIKNAIKYAEKYATKRNTSEYASYDRGDCANFVSQILEAGGVKQDRHRSEYFGWWHDKYWFFGTRHAVSRSWAVATAFAKYMKVIARYENHYNFSKNVYKGSIIGIDSDKDGNFDHIGFVTMTENFSKKYGNKTFYDYKVAQHTSDYYAWASWKNNHWADVEGKVIYGIIRYDGTY